MAEIPRSPSSRVSNSAIRAEGSLSRRHSRRFSRCFFPIGNLRPLSRRGARCARCRPVGEARHPRRHVARHALPSRARAIAGAVSRSRQQPVGEGKRPGREARAEPVGHDRELCPRRQHQLGIAVPAGVDDAARGAARRHREAGDRDGQVEPGELAPVLPLERGVVGGARCASGPGRPWSPRSPRARARRAGPPTVPSARTCWRCTAAGAARQSCRRSRRC